MGCSFGTAHAGKALCEQREPKEEPQQVRKLLKGKQTLMDNNRLLAKANRELFRIETCIETLNEKFINIVKSVKQPSSKLHPQTRFDVPVGVIQISDAHFNELINIQDNLYDFHIGAERFKLLADKAKIYFKSLGIKKVVIVALGDFLNSDRRLEEVTQQATNRMKAMFLSCHILEQFICDLNQDFNIDLAFMCGNESRVVQEHGRSDILLSYNYDWAIFNTLKIIFRNARGINFIDGQVGEFVVDINGHNVLLLHGETIKKDTTTHVQKISGKYARKGIKIDMTMFGHLHEAYISDFFSRSGSVAGANSYSEDNLNLSSKASQVIHFFFRKHIDSMKIDLQNTTGVRGYDIDKKLEAYNAKSAGKAIETQVAIVKVIN